MSKLTRADREELRYLGNDHHVANLAADHIEYLEAELAERDSELADQKELARAADAHRMEVLRDFAAGTLPKGDAEPNPPERAEATMQRVSEAVNRVRSKFGEGE